MVTNGTLKWRHMSDIIVMPQLHSSTLHYYIIASRCSSDRKQYVARYENSNYLILKQLPPARERRRHSGTKQPGHSLGAQVSTISSLYSINTSPYSLQKTTLSMYGGRRQALFSLLFYSRLIFPSLPPSLCHLWFPLSSPPPPSQIP